MIAQLNCGCKVRCHMEAVEKQRPVDRTKPPRHRLDGRGAVTLWSLQHMSCMSYYPCELGCRDRRRFQAGVLPVTGRRADGNSGVDPASPAVRASIGTASRRYTEGIAPREHEGTT